jgi:hypothetical protein
LAGNLQWNTDSQNIRSVTCTLGNKDGNAAERDSLLA